MKNIKLFAYLLKQEHRIEVKAQAKMFFNLILERGRSFKALSGNTEEIKTPTQLSIIQGSYIRCTLIGSSGQTKTSC